MANANFFPEGSVNELGARLSKLSQNQFNAIQGIQLKDPMIMLLLSLFLGGWGVDRFLLKETGLGVVKLLTCGGCGIWTIIDWFLVMNKTREFNQKLVLDSLSFGQFNQFDNM